MKPFQAQVKVEGRVLIAAGYAPFMVMQAGGTAWMVTGRDGCNCLAFPDGIRAIFDDQHPANLLCEWFNEQAQP